MLKTIGAVALAGFLAAGATGCTGEGAAAAATPQATTPKACVEGMIACMKSDDLAGIGKFIVEPAGPKITKMAEGMTAVEKGTDKLAKAVDAKFGPGTAKGIHIETRSRPELGDVQILEVKENGDTATVKTKETKKDGTPGKEETLELKKVNGQWYLNPPKDDDAFGEQTLAMADGMHKAATQAAAQVEVLAGDVSSGKVASKDAVQQK